MSLLIHLPLDGNLNNLGLRGDINFHVNWADATSSVDGGKISPKCYKNTSNTGGGITSNEMLYLGQSQSMFCWVKFTSLISSSNLGGGLVSQHRYTNNSGMGITIRYVSSTTGYISVNTGNGSSRTYNTYYGKTLLYANTWYHVGYTYSNNTIKLYVNGQLDGTFTYSNMLTPSEYLTVFSWSMEDESGTRVHANYFLNGCINDVRVYDHCLSAKEVKEISKGLILHYKLSGIGQENLLTNSANFSTWTKHSNGSEYIDTTNTIATIHTGTTTNSGYYLRYYPPSDSTYTYSVWVKRLSGNATSAYIGYNVFAGNNWALPALNSCQIGQWTKLTKTFKRSELYTSAQNSSYNVFYLICTGAEVLFSQPKLEEGDKATPWIPNKNDALYSQLGLDSSVEYDCSGYGRNGTKSGTFEYLTSNARYSTSIKFLSSASKIKLPVFTYSNIGNSYTFSWWEYNVGTGNMPWGFSDGNRLNLFHTTNLCWNTGDSSSNPFTPAIASSTLNNAWHHIAITGNGTETRLYIDGVYKGKATTYKPLTGTQIYISGWDSGTNYTFGNSKMSDFRIYATALSDDDIRQLCQTSAMIDNHNQAYAYEFMEV